MRRQIIIIKFQNTICSSCQRQQKETKIANEIFIQAKMELKLWNSNNATFQLYAEGTNNLYNCIEKNRIFFHFSILLLLWLVSILATCFCSVSMTVKNCVFLTMFQMESNSKMGENAKIIEISSAIECQMGLPAAKLKWQEGSKISLWSQLERVEVLLFHELKWNEVPDD